MLSDSQKSILQQNISSSLLHYDLISVIKMLDACPSLLLDTNYQITELNIQFSLPTKGLSLLHLAAYADFLEAFVYFTQNKQIPISITSADSFLPLHYALARDSLEITNYIFTKAPELFSSKEIYQNIEHSLLYYAIESNDLKIIKFLFNHGYSLKTPSNFRDLPMIIKKTVINRPSLLSYIIDNANISAIALSQTEAKLSLVMLSIISGNEQLVPLLIETGLDQSLEFSSFSGNSAFYYACSKNKKDVAINIFENMKKIEDNSLHLNGICYCLCKLCDPSLIRTVLFSNSYDIFCDPTNKRLFEKGINLLKLNPNKEPPLFALLDDKNLEKDNLPNVFEIIQLFIKKGYPIDFQPNGKNTLLGEACLSLYPDNKKPYELIEFLLKNGANPFAPVSIKKMPLFDYLKRIGSTRERSEEMKPLISLFEPYVEKYENEHSKDRKKKKASTDS